MAELLEASASVAPSVPRHVRISLYQRRLLHHSACSLFLAGCLMYAGHGQHFCVFGLQE